MFVQNGTSALPVLVVNCIFVQSGVSLFGLVNYLPSIKAMRLDQATRGTRLG
jgi:hypothetical protein